MPIDEMLEFCRKYPTNALCAHTPPPDPPVRAPTNPEPTGTGGISIQHITESTIQIREQLDEWGRLGDCFGVERIRNLRQLAADAGRLDLVTAIDRVLGE